MSKCSIFHNIFKYMIFQRRQKAFLWSKGLNTNADVASRVRGLNFVMSLYLHPYFVYTKSVVSGVAARMR